MNQDISRTDYFQNLRFVNRLASLSPGAQTTVMLVPPPGRILKDKLPVHASLYDADAMYKTAGETLQGAKLLDIRPELQQARKADKGTKDNGKQEKETQVYYRTDHHWTQYGAYVGYRAYCESVETKAASYASFGHIIHIIPCLTITGNLCLRQLFRNLYGIRHGIPVQCLGI